MAVENVALVGVGNLGIRHLQGLASCQRPLAITLIDPSSNAIARAHECWEDLVDEQSVHRIVDSAVPAYDLAIVATTADNRLAAIESLTAHAHVAAWLLEKPISQSLAALDRIMDVVSAPAWVNTVRRVIPWHGEIAVEIAKLQSPLDVRVEGGPWGLACNALHFVDLVQFWTGSTITQVDISGLDDHWHASKRPGYSDIFGSLRLQMADGTTLALTSLTDGAAHVITVTDAAGAVIRIEEGRGRAVLPCGTVLEGKMAFQSQLTGIIAQRILSGETAGLPTLADISHSERALLQALIPHRAADGGPQDHLDFT